VRVGDMLDFDVCEARFVVEDALFDGALDFTGTLGDAVDDLGKVGDAVGLTGLGHAGTAVEDAFEVLKDGGAECVQFIVRCQLPMI